MYIPEHFKVENREKIFKLCFENPFATVISVDSSGSPFISHLPLIIENKENRLVLTGHLAVRNPHAQIMKENSQTTIIFHGPHAYITPKWYKSGRDVPTWNYANVHMRGTITLSENYDFTVQALKKLTSHMENFDQNPWQFELPDDLLEPAMLTKAITAFEIQVEKVEAKFKLNQNRPAIDIEGILEGLSHRSDTNSLEVLKLMKN